MLTPRDWRERSVKVLAIIDRSLDARGYAPTIREISSVIGLAPATTHAILQHMQRAKLVDWDPQHFRTLAMTETGMELLEQEQSEEVAHG